jgi:hypothetical protein
MTIGVVDVFEVVGINEEDRTSLFLFDEPVESRDHFLIEEDAVVDASQLVVVIKLTEGLRKVRVFESLIKRLGLEDETGSHINEIRKGDLLSVFSDDDVACVVALPTLV